MCVLVARAPWTSVGASLADVACFSGNVSVQFLACGAVGVTPPRRSGKAIETSVLRPWLCVPVACQGACLAGSLRVQPPWRLGIHSGPVFLVWFLVLGCTSVVVPCGHKRSLPLWQGVLVRHKARLQNQRLLVYDLYRFVVWSAS